MPNIGYKDFFPQKKMLGFAKAPFDSVVDDANEWLAANKLQPISVETLSDFKSTQTKTVSQMTGIRVWFTK